MHPIQVLQIRLDALEDRLDARRVKVSPGQLSLNLTGGGAPGPGGEKCGAGWIDPRKTCRKGAGGAPAAAKPSRFQQLHQETLARKAAERERAAAEQQARAAQDRANATAALPVAIKLQDDGTLLINGQPPARALGGGAFGDTFMAETPSGPVVVKVDRLTNGDPLDTSYELPDRPTQRRNMVERERASMERAHALGLGPRPIGPVQMLPDGRLAFAYEMLPGVKLAADHRAMDITPEAAEVLRQPGAMARYAAGVARIARTMADAGFDHGDLHGGNVLLGPDGTPTLIDWGMAREVKNTLPHETIRTEAAALAVLGGHLVKINEQVNGTGGKSRRLARLKPSIDRLVGHGMSMGFKAAKAYRDITDAFDEEQWAAGYENGVENPGERIRQATALVKEKGIDFHTAERMVGLLPPLPDAVVREAEVARDRVFGPMHLQIFRRAVDRHYAAWGAA